MTDLRALITQLCDELDHNRRCLLDDRRLTHPLSDKARAALAKTDGPAVSGDRKPASVAKQCSGELSPAAQAVLDAYYTEADLRNREVTDCEMLAAAFRAAADQVVPTFWHEEGDVYAETIHDVRRQLLAIADELEAQ